MKYEKVSENEYEKVSENEREEIYISTLAVNVLIVASVNKGDSGGKNEWCAYIGATKSKDHSDKDVWNPILRTGNKLPKNIAEILFPFSKTHRWRK